MASPVEPNLELAQQWGGHLAELPTETARDQALAAARQARMLATPEEELEKIGRPPIRTLGEFLDTEVEIPPILVEPRLVARGGITAMSSRGGKGKTTVSFNRLLRWAAGLPLFDGLPDVMRPTEPLSCLIVENEGAGWHTQNMLRTMIQGMIPPDLHSQVRDNVKVWGEGGWSNMKLDKPENFELLQRGLQECKPDILFLEPFRTLWSGNENDSTEMAVVMDAFHTLANEHNCAIVITHHEVKGSQEPGADPMDRARGSGALSDLAAVMESWSPVAGGRQREWKLSKSRWAEPPGAVRMEYDKEIWGYHLVREDQNQRRVEEVLRSAGAMSELVLSELALEMEESQATIRRWADAAVEDGRLAKRMIQHGPTRAWAYRLPSAPNEDDPSGALGL